MLHPHLLVRHHREGVEPAGVRQLPERGAEGVHLGGCRGRVAVLLAVGGVGERVQESVQLQPIGQAVAHLPPGPALHLLD